MYETSVEYLMKALMMGTCQRRLMIKYDIPGRGCVAVVRVQRNEVVGEASKKSQEIHFLRSSSA